MLSRQLCHYNMSLSLHSRLISLATSRAEGRDGYVDIQKLLIMLAGVLAEGLMDYEDPFAELTNFDRKLRRSSAPLSHPDETARHGRVDDWAPVVSILDLDRYLELGRSLARLYVDDSEESSCILKNAIAHLLETSLSMWADDEITGTLQHAFFIKSVHYALSFEIVAHSFCDRIIDLKISQEKWSLGDCIMAMSGLSGRYYAFAALKEEDEMDEEQAAASALFAQGGASPAHSAYQAARPDDDDDDLGMAYGFFGGGSKPFSSAHSILRIMVGEAVRMGVPEGAGVFSGLAANDTEHRTCPHLIYSLEPSFAVLAERHGLHDYAVKAVAVSKAAGRMIAVASSGKEPEMEHIVARPIALSSFIGSFRHFSPKE